MRTLFKYSKDQFHSRIFLKLVFLQKKNFESIALHSKAQDELKQKIYFGKFLWIIPRQRACISRKPNEKKILQFLEFSFDGFLFEEENENFRLFSWGEISSFLLLRLLFLQSHKKIFPYFYIAVKKPKQYFFEM